MNLLCFACEFTPKFSRTGHRWRRGGRGDDHRSGRSSGTITRGPADRFSARNAGQGALHNFGLSDEQTLLAQIVERLSNQILADPDELGEAGQVVLAVAMTPDTRSDWAQAVSSMAFPVIEEKLLANRLLKETILTCSW